MRLKVTYNHALVRVFLIIFLLFSSWQLRSQILDDFSDGNFSASPQWTGTDSVFMVNGAKELQLNAKSAGSSYLALNNTQPLDNATWQFRLRLNFSPSSSNFARVYLVSDQSDLSGSLNGYFLQFGESGSADQVELFRQNGMLETSVCRGVTNISSAFDLSIKVTRNSSGLWTLYSDSLGGQNFKMEATGVDAQNQVCSYFGIYFSYTITNANKFFFDDLYIYAPPDVIPPKADSLQVIGKDMLRIFFNEPVSVASAQSASNYFVNGIGFASAGLPDSLNASIVNVQFTKAFVSATQYTLTITGTQDQSGNNTINEQLPFLYYRPAAHDIQINEIMVDVNPSPAGLPAVEYLELYNRSDYPASLKNWTLSDAANTIMLPHLRIDAKEHLVLSSVNGATALQGIVQAIGINGFPVLNDVGDSLILRNEEGAIISSALYELGWYHDEVKESGGWSLEQKDADCPCGKSINWSATQDAKGGTPGKVNSVAGINKDLVAPALEYVSLATADQLQVFFSEPMDSLSLMDVGHYWIDQGLGNPGAVNIVAPEYRSVILQLGSPLTSGQHYRLSANGLKDCAGNLIESSAEISFGLDELPSGNDLVINEILFDPYEGGVEWIEVYNRSQIVIDLKNVWLCSEDANSQMTDCTLLSASGRQLLPGAYLALSEDAASVRVQYPASTIGVFHNIPSLFTLNNDKDVLVLTDSSGKIIDRVAYESDWHHMLLNDTKGISLERLSADSPSQDSRNWHSAAEASGWATPGYKNSQEGLMSGGSQVSISPEVFSPDGDGHDDFLEIFYEFEAPGNVATVAIYDRRGKLIRLLAQNELLGASGKLQWDGKDEHHLIPPVGMYVVVFDLYNLSGDVNRYKNVFVLAKRN